MTQLLDDNSHQQPSATSVPRLWYFYHAAMVVGLFLFIFIMIFGILPLFPSFIEKALYETLLPILIFGIYGITFYTYYKGFKWEILPAFLAATFSFFFCFILTMNSLELVKYYTIQIINFFDISKDFLEIGTSGLFYSILVVPCTELILLIKNIYRRFSK